MKKIRCILVCIFSMFSVCAAHAALLVLPSTTISLIGSANGTSGYYAGLSGQFIYLGINTNPNGCANGGVVFLDDALRKEVLAVAITAKATGKTVRLDYTGGSGAWCIGTAIFMNNS